MIDACPTTIRDADLLEEVERARGHFLFKTIVEHIAHKQEMRDREAAERCGVARKRAAMGRDQRRRDEVREVIENEPSTPDSIQHIHSVLALCGLPYKEPKGEREFSRQYGRNTLNISAGRLTNPSTGQMELQGLPYGPKARLVLLHLCTEAVRQRSARIEVADSLSGFIKQMGFPVTGGERGTLRQFKEQLNRLAACTMQLGLWDGESRSRTLNVPPFRQMDIWLSGHPDQRQLWSNTVQFHADFYENLIQHALPVDIRAARAFAGSARKLDMLFWMGYRLRTLQRPLRLTWDNLHQQFGADNASIRSFKQAFKGDLAHIKEVFPRLRVSLDDCGMQLLPTDPSELLVAPKPSKPRSPSGQKG
jgi:hypothetical protein